MSSVLAVVGAAMGVASLGRGEALVGLLAAVEEEGGHEEDAGDEAPEEDALVAGDHFAAPCVLLELVVAPGGEGGGDGTGRYCCW